jgi:probable phosphoglycerate mutase
VIVSHGVAISVLRGLILGLDRGAMAALGNPQGVVIEIKNGEEITHEA